MGDLDFNVDEAPINSYEPLKGWYILEVTAAEVRDTKSGGKGLRVDFDVVDEKYNGRKVNNFFNIQNANPKAQQIGLGQLGDMCKAMGLGGVVSNSYELIGKKVFAKLDTQESKEISPDGTPYINQVVKAYKPLGGLEPVSSEVAKSVIDNDEVPF